MADCLQKKPSIIVIPLQYFFMTMPIAQGKSVNTSGLTIATVSTVRSVQGSITNELRALTRAEQFANKLQVSTNIGARVNLKVKFLFCVSAAP